MNLLRFRIMAGLLALGLAAGCKAQTDKSTAADPGLTRKIEVMVRSQFSMPPDIALAIGQRTPSEFPGYDNLPVTISRGSRSQELKFLISKDNKTLARLETYSLDKNPAMNIDISGRPVRGNPNAKVTVINFDDLECPYCARMHQSLFPTTLNRYKDKVRFVYKDDPLTEIHPWAMHAAVDANCLADQSGDVYWKYVDYLHSHGQEVNGEGQDRDVKKSFAALDRIAKDEGTVDKLDMDKLNACITKQDESKVKQSASLAESLGIEGTPALFIEGERINGAMPEEQLWIVIDRALRAAGVEPPPPQKQEPAPAPKPAGQ
ncbi:DsbA family protein [Occallatibacter riparius]|uniref:DsbA family protein n=1 Tax=Occallatibacter riparius TaxID=1002689 RepID=A0A9J7BUH4_9BACT|nr:DsbA family protein [Occallatibacter riparius]UWZ86233.1 DsbA family protein [Occallatibacter riparius]